MASPRGLEPRLQDPKSWVLPLDEGEILEEDGGIEPPQVLPLASFQD